MTATTGRQKIEELTNAWYAFTVVTALVSLFSSGIGVFSVLFTACSTAFSLFLTWFIGKRLLARSSLMRSVLVLISLVASIFGGLAAVRLGWSFLHEWSFAILVNAGLSTGSVAMNFRSFRTLTDPSVKAYFE